MGNIPVCKELESFTAENFRKATKNLQIGPYYNHSVAIAT